MLEKIISLKAAWGFLVLFTIVVGVIYSGVATPTEASAFGALGAFLLTLRRRLSLRTYIRAIVSALEASCMVGFIILCALVFGYFMTMTQTTQGLIDFLVGSGMGRWTILLLVLLVYLILGCFMDLAAMLILTVPIVHPLILELGFDPIWFAVVTIVVGEIAMVTPPLGMNVFVISKYTGIPVGTVFGGCMPHIVAHLFAVAILLIFPALVTWLPYSMN